MSNAEERITGKKLNQEWNVWAKHALYREDGKWYHQLTEFPGAYFDAQGFVLFEKKQDYLDCSFLQIGQDVHVPSGISSIPGYVYIQDQIEGDDTEYEGGSIYPYDMPEQVDISEDPQTVFEWMRKLKNKRLIIDPDFQRNRVWKPEQKSQFIESVVLNIPLPPLYVNQKRDGNLIIVDGLQRTATLAEYINDDGFELSDLRVVKELNGLRFSALAPKFQAKIEDKKLFIYVIKPTVPLPMVYDIFHRINTGGTQLSRQEIRNCFYIGPATKMLKDLAEEDYFRRAIDNGISPKRMKDREAILRCLAFILLDYRTDYKNDMDAFLGDALTDITVHQDRMPELRRTFERVMKITYEFWEKNNFRIPTYTGRGRINIALMESLFRFFAMRKDKELITHKNTILANYEELIRNFSFLNAIQTSTSDTRRVIRRFDLAEQLLGRF